MPGRAGGSNPAKNYQLDVMGIGIEDHQVNSELHDFSDEAEVEQSELAETEDGAIFARRPLATVVPPRFAIATGGTAYGRAALSTDVNAFAAMQPDTGRNARLNAISFGLHQIVAIGELDGAEVKRRLFDAAIANGLVRDTSRYAVLKTIDSGARAGLQNPRSKKKKMS
jgi:hypothetical protein